MKNHIVFKFIAILLCAACLTAAIGSAAGIIVLSAGNLYNRTVDQMLSELTYNNGSSYAYNLAMRYASKALGGCSDSMVRSRYGYNSWFESTYNYDSYGYVLKDAEGNVLESLHPELADTAAAVHTYPITGQYTHLVSAVPKSEKYPVQETQSVDPWVSRENVVLYDALPPEGTDFYYVNFGDESGSTGFGSDTPLGFAYYSNDGRVFFRTYESHHGILDVWPMDVYNITLLDADRNTIYEASSDSPLGILSYDDQDRLHYASYLMAETGTSDSSAFYEVTFLNQENETLYWLRSDDNHSLGTSYFDEDGYFRFTINMDHLQSYSEAGLFPDNMEIIFGVILCDYDGSQLYEAYSRSGLGTVVYNAVGELSYRSNYPEQAAAEAIPVATISAEVLPAETAPETTVPEETTPEETAAEETAVETQSEETTESTTAEETTAETLEETAPEETEEEEAAALSEDGGDAAESIDPTAPEETAEGESTDTTEPEVTQAPTEPEPTVEVTVPAETVPVTEPAMINGKLLSEYGINSDSYYDTDLGETVYADYIYLPLPEYTVEMYFADRPYREQAAYDLLEIVHGFRNELFLVLGASVLLFVIFLIYLCCAAGRKPKSTEVRAGALNRLPLDLYLGCGAFAITGLVIGLVEGGAYLLRQDILTGCIFAVSMAYLACLLVVGFLFAFVAQVKTPGGFWYRNTLCGWCIRLLFRFCAWLEKNTESKLWPAFVKLCKWCWSLIKKFCLFLFSLAVNCGKWIANAFNRFLSLLPLTWQWLLAGFILILVLVICIDGFKDGNDISLPLGLLFAFALIFYGTHCFGTLLESTKRMSKGDLDTKVDDKLMIGCFEDFAHELNALADVAVVAAQKQLKSERMKTELITNVSHDIKTPLTSIINYVDLLQKPHTEEEQEIYLEVLQRQSQQLKKLIEDLMDMSKASTGNMAVEVTRVDAVESINQALGEFADKLDKVQLIPVFRHTEESVAMMADGKLVWRVLSNLLSNAVKYALPGTRLYIDLMELEGKVVISLKNISREELNVDADELMERFVRGDDSRNTEGSGLGLNIAKSLMELQKGQLQLLVDGDLFKVTLIFPGA